MNPCLPFRPSKSTDPLPAHLSVDERHELQVTTIGSGRTMWTLQHPNTRAGPYSRSQVIPLKTSQHESPRTRSHNWLITGRQPHTLSNTLPRAARSLGEGLQMFSNLPPMPPSIFLSLHPLLSTLQAKYNVSDFPSYILIRFESCLLGL